MCDTDKYEQSWREIVIEDLKFLNSAQISNIRREVGGVSRSMDMPLGFVVDHLEEHGWRGFESFYGVGPKTAGKLLGIIMAFEKDWRKE